MSLPAFQGIHEKLLKIFEDKLTHGLVPGKRVVVVGDGRVLVRSPLRDGPAGYFQVINPDPWCLQYQHLLQHLLLLSSGVSTPLTLGTFTVNNILGWDTARERV